MSAGYIQLAALGQQDAYLSGEPQVTYFSGMYKRHTPFVLEAYDIAFNGTTITYGETGICRIPPKGDLIRGLTLKMILPALYDSGTDWIWGIPSSPTNYPALWFGLPNGTITPQIVAPVLENEYYSSNATSLSIWFTNFTPYASYSGSLNQFIFQGVSNVIVQPGSGLFWGFDPINYSTLDQYGNLVYNATTSTTVTPTYSLQQSGWYRSVNGVAISSQTVNPLVGAYFSVAQNYPFAPGLNFLNFNAFTPSNTPYWTLNDLDLTSYFVTSTGLVKILQPGRYTVRLGFNLDTAAVVSVSYGISATQALPYVPSFVSTHTYTVSPNPTSPAVLPVVVPTPGYYYFYVTVNGGCTALPGSYMAITHANDIYQFSNAVTLSSPSLAPVPIYGNVYPPSGASVTLNPDSTLQFSKDGEYLITGVLSLSNTVLESYVSNVVLGEGSNTLYVYDMSSQGQNPTQAFSLPLVANAQSLYYINVSSTEYFSDITANSFFIIEQIGVTPSTSPSIVFPYNGTLLQSNNTTFTSPLNFSTEFTSNTNSQLISVNATGNLVFANTMSYMFTGVFYTSSPVTAVTLSSPNGFSQSFQMAYGFSTSPPYTISVPFRITDTTTVYDVTLTASGTIDASSYIAISPLATNAYSTFQTIYNYYDGVGTIAIVDATLKIGGQTIQRLTGEYIETWNELNVPYENQPGLQLLTGKYDTHTSVGVPGRTYYVNLPFYFYEKPELSIPIVALERQDVEVWVTFNEFSQLTSYPVANPTLQATIITEYVYLSNPEINWFKTHQLEYIITQCQYDQFILSEGFRSAVFELFFKHPVNELFFMIHPDTNLPYNYTTPGGGTDLVSLGMTFNGEDAFLASTTNTLYIGALVPFRKHTNFFSQPTVLTAQQPNAFGRQFYMYSFDPGHVNFSRIRQVLLEMNVRNTTSNYPSKTMNVIVTNKNVMKIANGVAGVMYS
jgi:hypothetical protein